MIDTNNLLLDQMAYKLYYSTSCAYCRNFCKQLAAMPELNSQFRFIDVATIRTGGMSVPMLLADNQQYVGRDAFVWLQQRVQQAAGPQCYDLSGDQNGVVFTGIGEHGTSSRADAFCHL